jgi:hypothetical protein
MTIDQPGSFFLVNNLTATGNCLRITAASVSIDLAGFAIVGNGSGTGVFSTSDLSEVRNGIIQNFNIGVIAGVVENVRAFANTATGIATQRRAKNNLAERNGDTGLSASGVIIENTAVANAGDGIFVRGRSTVISNIALDNGGNGISDDIGGSTMMSNVVSGNGGVGIFMRCPGVVAFNTSTSNDPGPNIFLPGACSTTQNRSGRLASGRAIGSNQDLQSNPDNE